MQTVLILARFEEEADSFFQASRARVVEPRRIHCLPGLVERESSLLTTYWSEST